MMIVLTLVVGCGKAEPTDTSVPPTATSMPPTDTPTPTDTPVPPTVTPLVRCGALDGLGESRAALLVEAEEIERAGSALQMSLFGEEARGRAEVAPESLDQRLAWEKHLLGYPVSTLEEPLKLVVDRLPEHVPLCRLPGTSGRTVTVAGVRLPGWTGGKGFYLWDGETWVIARTGESQEAPSPWEPLLLRGRWVGDEWGTCWLQVEEWHGIR